MYKQHDCPSRNEYSSHRYKELLYTIGDEYHVYTIPRARNNRASTWLPSKMGSRQTAHLIQQKTEGVGESKARKQLNEQRKEIFGCRCAWS